MRSRGEHFAALPALPPPRAHTDLGHKLINNPVIWIGMEREWEIGTQARPASGVGSGTRRVHAGWSSAQEAVAPSTSPPMPAALWARRRRCARPCKTAAAAWRAS